MVHSIENIDSSLISEIYWCDESLELTIVFRNYYLPYIIYSDVTRKEFNKFIASDSVGKYFLSYIKNKFKMSEANEKKMPTGINVASDKKRFIQLRINVKKIIKDWIIAGEQGDYLDMTLHMQPDGQVDKFGNLGFITQSVPKHVWEKNKDAKGEILGNGRENVWNGSGSSESNPSSDIGSNIAAADDLPF